MTQEHEGPSMAADICSGIIAFLMVLTVFILLCCGAYFCVDVILNYLWS